MTNLDSILKSRDIPLPTKAHLVKAMVFPVVIYGCESWTIKKAERRRIDASELWCWRRLLRVPWTARRSNQSILKEISPECSLEGLMLKLKLQSFGHLMRSWLIGKDPDSGRDWGQEEKGMTEDEMVGWHHPLDGHEFEWTPGAGDGQGGLVCCNSWGRKESDRTERLNWLTDWLTQFTELFVVRLIHSHVNIINYYKIPLKRYGFGTYLYKEKTLNACIYMCVYIYVCVYIYIFWEKVCLVCLKKPIKSDFFQRVTAKSKMILLSTTSIFTGIFTTLISYKFCCKYLFLNTPT